MAKITDNEAAQIGKALGDPNRLAIYTQIAQHKNFSAARCTGNTLSPGPPCLTI
jgi:hypothetical protein